MKLFKYETLGSQIAFIKAVERFAEEVVRLALPESVFGRRFRTVRRQFAGLSSAPKKGCTGDGCENQQHRGQHQKRRAPLFPAPQRQICRDLQTV
jgi:hypothetical protein